MTSATQRSIHSRSRVCPQCGGRRDVRGELCRECRLSGTPDDGTLDRIRVLGATYAEMLRDAARVRAELDMEVRAAKREGYSYSRLRDATGLSVASIQAIVAKGLA